MAKLAFVTLNEVNLDADRIGGLPPYAGKEDDRIRLGIGGERRAGGSGGSEHGRQDE